MIAMKLKILMLAVLFSLFSIVSFAQEINFDIQISLNQEIFRENNKNIPVKILITNKAEQELDTSKLGSINFYFSKCPKIKACYSRGDLFISSDKVGSKILKKDESFEFETNLADLYWVDASSSMLDLNKLKNLNKVPSGNKYFYADIKIFDKYYEEKELKIPTFKSFKSNEIIQTIK
jgi:hypothetical protein